MPDIFPLPGNIDAEVTPEWSLTIEVGASYVNVSLIALFV